MHTLQTKQTKKKQLKRISVSEFIVNELTSRQSAFSLAMPSLNSEWWRREKKIEYSYAVSSILSRTKSFFSCNQDSDFDFFFLPSSVSWFHHDVLVFVSTEPSKRKTNTQTHSSCTGEKNNKNKTKKWLKNLLCSASHFHLDGSLCAFHCMNLFFFLSI